MAYSRRRLLSHGAAALFGLTASRQALAKTNVGDMTVQMISDGFLTLSRDYIFDPLPAEIRKAAVDDFELSSRTLEAPCNLTLVQRNADVILFDAGSGPGFQPTAGDVVDGLAALGLAPEDVTHVVFTHAHPDHLWGVLDDFDDPVFSQAEHMMGRLEFDYWSDPSTLGSIDESRQPFVVGAARRLEAIGERVSLFDDGQEILPGVFTVLAPGHTPGHMCFEVRSGNDALMILGDAISNHHVAMRFPSAPLGSDQDMSQAAKTRHALLDRIARQDMRVAGFHLPDGGFGRIDSFEDGFVFVPQA